MSKLYKKYVSLKVQDSGLIYIFKTDTSYIFIDEDAKLVSSILNLSLSNIDSMILKCEFPVSESYNYLEILKTNNIDFEIIDLLTNSSYKPYESSFSFKLEKFLTKIASTNSNSLSMSEAFLFIDDISSESKILLEDFQENNFNNI